MEPCFPCCRKQANISAGSLTVVNKQRGPFVQLSATHQDLRHDVLHGHGVDLFAIKLVNEVIHLQGGLRCRALRPKSQTRSLLIT